MSLLLNGLRSSRGLICRLPGTAAATSSSSHQLHQLWRSFGDEKSTPEAAPVAEAVTAGSKLSGFAQAFERHSQPTAEAPAEAPKSFAALLRNSKFVDLGDPEGKLVNGKIFHIVDDDLYIDFGWKFHCVCTRPTRNASEYVRGAKVRLRIKDLELSTRFLGSEKDLTILEADCQIVGLVASPARNTPHARSYAAQ